MNPQSRPMPLSRAPLGPHPAARAGGGLPSREDPPSLAHILAHYRQHGTVARLAVEPAPPAAERFDEVIEGLHTRELDGGELFDHFFGPGAR